MYKNRRRLISWGCIVSIRRSAFYADNFMRDALRIQRWHGAGMQATHAVSRAS